MSSTASKTLTPERAAQRLKVSRWTISRALQAGRLKGLRDNRGRWRIEVVDLEEWALHALHTEQHGAEDASHTEQLVPPAHPAHSKERELAAEVAELRAKLNGLESELALEHERTVQERARADRERETVDDLRVRLDQAEAERRNAMGALEEERRTLRVVLDRITVRADPEPEPAPRRGFFARLLGA